MSAPELIPGTEEAWETGQLGLDPEYARVHEDASTEEALDRALALKMISIRLEEDLIDDFKRIAEMEGIGYQTLMRTVLRRFAESEMRMMARKYMADIRDEKIDCGEDSRTDDGGDGVPEHQAA